MSEKHHIENAERTSLEEQFDHPETYRYGSTPIEVYDIQPENIKSEVPAFFVPGWAASPEVFRENILLIAKEGRRVLSANTVHGIDQDPDFGKGDKKYVVAELRKAAALIKVIEKKGIEKIDLITHSEGSINGLIAATMIPDKIRNIILVNPAGLIGKDTFPRLLKGFSLEQIHKTINDENRPTYNLDRVEKKPGQKHALNVMKNVAGNVLQSLREGLAIANSDIKDMLKSLKDEGKHIAVIHGAQDHAFPMNKMQEIVDDEMVDGFYSVKGGHNQVILNPAAYTKVINHALDALEAKAQNT
jgi:pimeloyl-ACP methyl ester carboxylesterase